MMSVGVKSLMKSVVMIVVASAALSPSAVAARVVQPEKWKEFAPSGGGFKVLLPREPKRDKTDEATYTGRWQLQAGGDGAAHFRVMYVEAAPSCHGAGDVSAALLGILREKALAELKGHVVRDAAVSFAGDKPGRLIEIAPAAAGHARVLLVAAGRRAYRLDATTPGDAEADRTLSARFFNSFSLSPAQAQDSGEVDKLIADGTARPSGGVLMDGKVVRKPAPQYPATAKAARASGQVLVKVVVSEEGKVLAAQAVAGHPLLRDAAVTAARQITFEPTLDGGKPVRAFGCVTYNFFLR